MFELNFFACLLYRIYTKYLWKKKLEFTDRAKSQIEKITKSEDKKYFRIEVQGGGCSGFKYNFSFDDKLQKNDILFDQTVIDKESLEIISGSIVDFKKRTYWRIFCNK